MDVKRIQLPLAEDVIAALRTGDRVLLSGALYTARDAAHKRIVEGLAEGVPAPFDLRGAVIYYCGPTPRGAGRPIGAAGPTTSSRMDSYVEALVSQGVKGFIGKGERSPEAAEVLRENKVVYFAAIGGLGALLSLTIKTAVLVAYADLGPEAVYELKVEDFPAIVALDIYGGDAYREAVGRYKEFLQEQASGTA